MAITPMDIHRHEFSTSRLGGYKAEEVDAFLDQIADELEMLLQRNHEMNEALEEMRVRLREYDSMQQTLQNAFINAQKSADALVQDSKNQAEAILAEARKKGEAIFAGLRGEKEKMETSFQDVKQMVTAYIGSARELLEKQLAGLKQFEASGMTAAGGKAPEPPKLVKPSRETVPEAVPEIPLAEIPMPAPPLGQAMTPPASPATTGEMPSLNRLDHPEETMPPRGVQTMAADEVEEAAQAALADMEPVVPEEPPMFEAQVDMEAEADESEGKRKRHFFWE